MYLPLPSHRDTVECKNKIIVNDMNIDATSITVKLSITSVISNVNVMTTNGALLLNDISD